MDEMTDLPRAGPIKAILSINDNSGENIHECRKKPLGKSIPAHIATHHVGESVGQ